MNIYTPGGYLSSPRARRSRRRHCGAAGPRAPAIRPGSRTAAAFPQLRELWRRIRGPGVTRHGARGARVTHRGRGARGRAGGGDAGWGTRYAGRGYVGQVEGAGVRDVSEVCAVRVCGVRVCGAGVCGTRQGRGVRALCSGELVCGVCVVRSGCRAGRDRRALLVWRRGRPVVAPGKSRSWRRAGGVVLRARRREPALAVAGGDRSWRRDGCLRAGPPLVRDPWVIADGGGSAHVVPGAASCQWPWWPWWSS